MTLSPAFMSTSHKIIAILVTASLALSGCASRVVAYGDQEAVHLAQSEPAPFSGWLLSDADLEMLLKGAESAGAAPSIR